MYGWVDLYKMVDHIYNNYFTQLITILFFKLLVQPSINFQEKDKRNNYSIQNN